jgi:hypothetical protein
VSFKHSVSGNSAELKSAYRVVTASPDLHLVFAESRRHFGFVQTLQRAIMALVETPRAVHRNPHQIHFVLDDPKGSDGSLQHRCERHIERETFRLQRGAGVLCLFSAQARKVYVGPSGKPVLQIPLALAVADKRKFGHLKRR